MTKLGKGKMTKAGVGLVAIGIIIQAILDWSRSGELSSVADAAEGTLGSITTLVGTIVAAWGSFRATVLNYGERRS